MKFRILLATAVSLLFVPAIAQNPILNSLPAVTDRVIYLDFDGEVVTATGWNNGGTINAAPSTLSYANKIVVWKRVSEDYRPFQVNITTDLARFNLAPANKRTHVIVTPTSAWYGSAGGVAFVGSFAWGGTPGTPCWVFENQLGYSAKNVAEAAAHEAGHTLSLKHQSTYDAQCNKTNEYNPGTGSGVTSWAPIMGVGYSKNVTTWYNGKSTLSCNTIQLDHSNSTAAGITAVPYLSFRNDDVGNTAASAKILNLNYVTTSDSGIITTPADIDAYRFDICQSRTVTIDVKPWALDTTGYNGANLDVRLFLYEASSNSLVAVDTNLSRLYGRVAASLTPGSYYFTVDGGRSNYYSDYGSLGLYYVTVKATNPPAVTASAAIPGSICDGQQVTLSGVSNASNATWLWTLTNGSTSASYSTQTMATTLAPASVYTVSLTASNGTVIACPFTATMASSPVPTITVTGNQQPLCAPATATLIASGAQTYTWMPSGATGSLSNQSPAANTIYTVTGSNNGCTASESIALAVVPFFSLNVIASPSVVCEGASFTLSASGATSYTINPGGIVSNPAVITPTVSNNYFVYGDQGGCVKSASKYVTVIPTFSVGIGTADTSICLGSAVQLSFTGANTYTLYPGGMTGNPVVISPQTTTSFTITGENQTCTEDAYLAVTVELCDNSIPEQAFVRAAVFPNPCSDKLTVVTPGRTAFLFDCAGRIIKTTTITAGRTIIDITDVPAGLYFLKIAHANGEVETIKATIE